MCRMVNDFVLVWLVFMPVPSLRPLNFDENEHLGNVGMAQA